jgi:hypothetical protein
VFRSPDFWESSASSVISLPLLTDAQTAASSTSKCALSRLRVEQAERSVSQRIPSRLRSLSAILAISTSPNSPRRRISLAIETDWTC